MPSPVSVPAADCKNYRPPCKVPESRKKGKQKGIPFNINKMEAEMTNIEPVKIIDIR